MGSTLSGGSGFDWLVGDLGADTFSLGGSFGVDIIDVGAGAGESGLDVVQLSGHYWENTLEYRMGDHFVIVDTTTGDLAVILDFYDGASSAIDHLSYPSIYGGTETWAPTDDDDFDGVLDIHQVIRPTFGTDGGNTITAPNTTYGEVVYGGLGNDTLTGNSQYSILSGGGGNDTLIAGPGIYDTVLIGGSGGDTYRVTSGRIGLISDLGSSSGDRLEASGVSLSSSNLVLATIDGRHLFLGDAGNNTNIIVFDWQYSVNRIETYVLGSATYSYAYMSSYVTTSGTPDFTWEALGISTAFMEATLDFYRELDGDDVGPDFNAFAGGTSASETVQGFSGDNVILGDTGNDTLIGRGGNDRYLFRTGDGDDRVDGITGASLGERDILQFAPGIAAEDLSISVSGNDLVIDYTASDSIRVLGWYGSQSNLARQLDVAFFGGGSHALLIDTSGTAGADLLFGTVAASTFAAGGGNDTVYAGGGNDTLDGGSGNDFLDGGSGNDVFMYTGAVTDDDTITDSSGTDTIQFDGIDPFATVSQVARIGSDLVFDFAAGGSLTFASFFSGSAIETLSYDGTSYALDQGFTGTASFESFLGVGGEHIVGSDGVDDDLVGTDYGDTIEGLSGNDELFGENGDDTLFGGTGDDTLAGGAGDDTVDGGDGNDLIVGGSGAGDDDYSGGTGLDTVTYASATTGVAVDLDTGSAAGLQIGTDSLSGIEHVIGGSGHDVLTGDSGANHLAGSAGSDTLWGRGGNDTLDGGTGNDTYVYTSSDGADTLVDASGIDLVSFAGPGILESIRRDGNDLVFDLSDSGAPRIENHFAGNQIEQVSDNGKVYNLLISLSGGDGHDAIVGTDSGEVMNGYGGDDVLFANGGNDTIYAGDGGDGVYAGDGDDTIDGGSGNDLLVGGIGDDLFVVSGALTDHDYIIDSDGADTIHFDGIDPFAAVSLVTRVGSDLVFDYAAGGSLTFVDFFSGFAVETLTYDVASFTLDQDVTGTASFEDFLGIGGGGQHILGSDGVNDNLVGTDFGDTIEGRGGDDTLSGGGGDDTLDGGSNNDTLIGGTGDDILDGGSGDDRFVISGALTDSDTITDSSGADAVLFDGIDPFAAVGQVARIGSDLVFDYVAGGSLTFDGFFSGSAIETLTYDGTSYTLDQGFTGTASFTDFLGDHNQRAAHRRYGRRRQSRRHHLRRHHRRSRRE